MCELWKHPRFIPCLCILMNCYDLMYEFRIQYLSTPSGQLLVFLAVLARRRGSIADFFPVGRVLVVFHDRLLLRLLAAGRLPLPLGRGRQGRRQGGQPQRRHPRHVRPDPGQPLLLVVGDLLFSTAAAVAVAVGSEVRVGWAGGLFRHFRKVKLLIAGKP